MDLQLGQGKVDAKGCEDINEDGTEGKLGRCIGGELPVDLGIPGLSLKTGDGGAVKGSVGWNLDLSIGLSRSRGFYVNTNKVPNQPEFRVGASLGLTEVTGPKLKASSRSSTSTPRRTPRSRSSSASSASTSRTTPTTARPTSTSPSRR